MSDYYIQTRDIYTGKVLSEVKTNRNILFYYEKDRLRYGSKLKETVCLDNTVYRVIGNNIFEKWIGNKYERDVWCDGSKYGRKYVLVDKNEMAYYQYKLDNVNREREYLESKIRLLN